MFIQNPFQSKITKNYIEIGLEGVDYFFEGLAIGEMFGDGPAELSCIRQKRKPESGSIALNRLAEGLASEE